MSKIKNGGLHQYGTEPFEQQQFGTAGVEGVNVCLAFIEIKNVGLCATHSCEVRPKTARGTISLAKEIQCLQSKNKVCFEFRRKILK